MKIILFDWEPVDVVGEHHFFDETLISAEFGLGLEGEEIGPVVDVVPEVVVLFDVRLEPVFGRFIQFFIIISANKAEVL